MAILIALVLGLAAVGSQSSQSLVALAQDETDHSASSGDSSEDTDPEDTDPASTDPSGDDSASSDDSASGTDSASDSSSSGSTPDTSNPAPSGSESTPTTDPGTGDSGSTPPTPPSDATDANPDPSPAPDPAPAAPKSAAAPTSDATVDAPATPNSDSTVDAAVALAAAMGGTVDQCSDTGSGGGDTITCTARISVLAAQAPVGLGTVGSFAVLGGSTVTNTGPSVISGDLGVSPGTAVVGFPPGTVINGTIHAADAVALQAQADLTVAYDDAAGRACDVNLSGSDLGGLTLVEGAYCFDTSAFLTGTVTLDAAGDPNAVFIFQIGSTLISASGSVVDLINGAQACNVYWQVGSSATLGTDTTFVGNVLALTSITAQTGTTVDGSLLARNGAVTLDTNVITRAECAIDDGGGGGGDTGGGGTGGTTGGTTGDTTGGGGNGGGGNGGGNGGGDSTRGGGNGGSGNGGGDSTRGGGGGTGSDDSLLTGAASESAQGVPASDRSRQNLPFTGLDVRVPILGGIVMLLLGAGLMRTRRFHRVPR